MVSFTVISDIADKLPEELKANYQKQARKASPVIESLKVAAALKLWKDRGFEDIRFDVPVFFGGKNFFVKVLARHSEGAVFGVECASNVRLRWLRERVVTLQLCLPRDSYVVAVFPEAADKRVGKVVKLVDEVWVTGKSGVVNQILFSPAFHKG